MTVKKPPAFRWPHSAQAVPWASPSRSKSYVPETAGAEPGPMLIRDRAAYVAGADGGPTAHPTVPTRTAPSALASPKVIRVYRFLISHLPFFESETILMKITVFPRLQVK